ncbi:MAG: acyl-CoA dehydrogenase family protein [Alphaproteobacteria bacterium]
MTTIDYDAMDDDSFRRMVRDFFEANYPQEWRFPPYRLSLRLTAEWDRTLYRQGWAAPAWPRDHGGMGLDPVKQVIMAEEAARVGIERGGDLGKLMLAPLLMRFGSDEQKKRFLPRTLSTEIIWCQGYSEPDAGSDLANLRTRAVRDGDHYVVNGSKIWTSHGHIADWIFLLARTGDGKKKQDGISFLLIDMKTPGITVRPIINLSMEHDFNQVFFDNVRVPVGNRVGEEGKGWSMAKALLGFERITIGSPAFIQYPMARLGALARDRGAFSNPAFVERYTQLRLDIADLGATFSRFLAVLRRGSSIGPEASILKLVASETFQRITELMLDVAGADAAIDEMLDLDGEATHMTKMFFVARPATIYGGSSEVQRNVVAKAVLNLPR